MLDTNVLISIVIFDSNRLKEMLVRICDNYRLVLSSYVIQELQEVTQRKFLSKRKYLDKFLFNLPYELEYTPVNILDKRVLKLRDKKDIPILNSAIISNVDILITGDKDFKDIDIDRPEIITPTEFLEKY